MTEDDDHESSECGLAVETLRASEEKYRSIFRDAAIGIFRSTFEGRFIEVNPALAKLLGYDSADEVVRSITNIAEQVFDEPLRRDEVGASAFEAGGLVTAENRYRRKDGTLWEGRTHIRVARDLQGKPSHYVGFVEDITSRKQAEAQLKESEHRLREAQRLAHIGVWEWRAQTDTVVWTEELYRIAGLAPNVPAPTYEEQCALYETESWQLLKSSVERAVATGESYQLELRLVRPDGTVRTVNAYGGAKRDAKGQVDGLFGTVQDITERKQAEEAVHTSQALLAAVVDSTSDLIWSVESETFGLLSFNRGLSEYFLKYRGTELQLGMRPEDMFPAEGFVSVWNGFYRRALAEGPYVTDYSGIAGPAVMHLTVCLLRRRGKVYGISVFGRDITALKQAEAEKARLEAQLHHAQKMESVGRLAGGVAHDFNNMLGVIIGNVDMAVEHLEAANPLRVELEEIRSAAEHSASLTRQLLAFARRQPVAPKVLDLNETVESMLKMLRRLIGEDIALVWLPGAGLRNVNLDPSQIDQILANLCVNARDAIGSVGRLTIETANSTLDGDYCATHVEAVPGEYVKLAVSDDGCGMDRPTQERLFEPFFTTKGLGKGTGLGLATVYGIVKQNDGFINVTSDLGKGTTFTIYLPQHVGEGTTQAQPPPSPVPVARGHETILVVEDEPAILKMTTKMLARQGFTVLTASTPSEAIRLARAHTGDIHLLITDVVMPEMNGRDLATNLMATIPSLKRLFMSGYTADAIAHHGVLEDGAHFIEKPFSKRDFAAKVSQALGR